MVWHDPADMTKSPGFGLQGRLFYTMTRVVNQEVDCLGTGWRLHNDSLML